MISNFARKAMLCAVPAIVAAMTCFAGTAQAGSALQYRVLHKFCQSANCADGYFAVEAPLLDPNGNLFGVTHSGGEGGGFGALWELTPKHDGARYFKHVLTGFCDAGTGDCPSGGHPLAGPIMDVNGNIYGTTSSTPSNGCGTVYEAVTARAPNFGKPRLKVLHTFFSKGDGCAPNYGSLDYQGKESGQLYDGASPLYGMTQDGGLANKGAVYELTPPVSGQKSWSERLIYQFCVQTPRKDGGVRATNCTDGSHPQGNLVMDQAGDLFGETSDGKIFELSPDGSGFFNFRVLYTSTTSEEYDWLALESDGTLAGVSQSGGASGSGTLFTLTPDTCKGRCTAIFTYSYTLLHDFCTGACTDGAGPNSLVMDSSGNLFGTTFAGGTNPAPPHSTYTGAGTVFEYTKNGGLFFPIHEFCAETDCADGGAPVGGLMMDSNGNMYGTTAGGGSTANVVYGAGTVYELSLPQ
jgi:hypothetical protein